MTNARYGALPEPVRRVLLELSTAETAIQDYRSRRPDLSRAESDSRAEMHERLRHMRHCIYKVATNRFVTSHIPAPDEDQNPELMDHEESRFYMEGFYGAAWRIHRIMLFLTGEKIPWDGVNMVRNKLIEHCQDQDLKDQPLFINSIDGNHTTGPKLKGLRWTAPGDRHVDQGLHLDQGLYVNASEFLRWLTERLGTL